MSDYKDISVVVPVYNMDKYLDKCLQSLQNQSFFSYEVILVDDGSTDNSRKIAERYVETHGEIFQLVVQENQGLSVARNTGMKYANGKYLCFVDSDDSVEADYLQKLYQCAVQTEAELVFCAFRSVDEEGNCLKEVYESGFEPGKIYTLQDRKDLLLTQNAAWNKLYVREIIAKNDLQFTPGAWYEDLRFVKKYMLFASKFTYCDSILYHYLIRKGSIMSSIGSKRNIEILEAIDEVVGFYSDRKLYDEFHEEIEFLAIDHVYISALVRLIRSGDKGQFTVMKRAFLERFPDYRKNRYIGRLQTGRKVAFCLLNMHAYGVIKLLFAVKEKN